MSKRENDGPLPDEPKKKRKKGKGPVIVTRTDNDNVAHDITLTDFALAFCHALSDPTGNEFPTHYLEEFQDTGKIPPGLYHDQQAELVMKLMDVVGEGEYKKLDEEYLNAGANYVLDVVDKFKRHYLELEKEVKRQVDAQVQAEQVQALTVSGGSLNILFLPVGHGDCTVIRTPAGKTFLIDCGSSGGFDVEKGKGPAAEAKARLRVRDSIRTMLGGDYKLDFLILTHPDRDHYNKLRTVFDKTVPLQIGAIYHSASFSKYGESTWYLNRLYNGGKLVKGRGANSRINQIYFRYAGSITKDEMPSFSELIQPLKGKLAAVPGYDSTKRDALHTLGEHGGLLIWAEPNCRFYLLSGSANQEHQDISGPGKQGKEIKDQSTAENRGSVVLYIEAFGKKILICGDATLNTEEELITRYKDLIQNVDILRVGHHGSNVTSSGKKFIDHVKPKQAWISECVKSNFHSPSIEVLRRLWEHATPDVDGHDIYFFYGQSSTGYNGVTLMESVNRTINDVVFTQKIVGKYLKKPVYLTAMTKNTKVDISKS